MKEKILNYFKELIYSHYYPEEFNIKYIGSINLIISNKAILIYYL